MLQLEHVERMLARPNTKDYGSFSCFVQYYAKIKKLFNISNKSFQPAPKVLSCFVHLTFPENKKPKAQNDELLFKIIRCAFNQRRKNILNSLSPLKSKPDIIELLNSLDIDIGKRAENLTLEDFVRIADSFDR